MNCPHCQVQLAQDARFCPACGKAAQATTPEPAASGPLRAQNAMIGREIAGRFRILALLGEGGMGAVYRGEQMSLKRAVAVKVLRPELSANQMLLRRFSTEAEAVAKLDHPNTVKVYDFGQDSDGSLFIAMELVDGKPLREVLAAAGAFPPARALNIALQVCASLIDAHAINIVHRDLKPDNVMLVDKARQKDVVRVLDFGIAKLRDDSRATQQAMTQAGDMLGTPQYMAPEQIKGEAIDGRTDIYALGCLVYEMVTARLPFEATSVMAMLSKHLIEMPLPPSQRRPDLQISPALDHVVMAALQKEPSQRPANMEQYAEMLAGVLAQYPSDSRPLTAQHQHNTPAPMPIVPSTAGAGAALGLAPSGGGASDVGRGRAGDPSGFSPTPSVTTPIPPTSRVQPQPQYSPYPQPQPSQGAFAHSPPAAPRKSHSLVIFMVIGALGLAGAGAAIYSAAQKSNKKGTDEDSYKAKIEKPEVEEDKDKEKEKDPDPQPPPATGSDPWDVPSNPSSPQAAPPRAPRAAKAESVGTNKTPIPSGAHLNPPPGFVKFDNKYGWQSYAEQQSQIVMLLMPLDAGTNDPQEIQTRWIANNGDLKLTAGGITQNQGHPMLSFVGTFNNAPMAEYVTLFITSRYRLAYVVQAPVGDGIDYQIVAKLIYSGVTVP